MELFLIALVHVSLSFSIAGYVSLSSYRCTECFSSSGLGHAVAFFSVFNSISSLYSSPARSLIYPTAVSSLVELPDDKVIKKKTQRSAFFATMTVVVDGS